VRRRIVSSLLVFAGSGQRVRRRCSVNAILFARPVVTRTRGCEGQASRLFDGSTRVSRSSSR